MPLPVITNVYRLALLWANSNNDQSAVNVMHFLRTTGTAEDVLDDFVANATGTMWGTVSARWRISELDCTKLDGSSATHARTGINAANLKGTNGTDFIPQAASIIKHVTGTRGRSFRGRTFLPGVPESEQADGILSSTTVGNVSGAWETFRTSMATDGSALVVASYKLSSASLVESSTCEPQIATQRRRQDRVRNP